MIRFDRVSKRYPSGIDALNEFTLDIADGELVVISGHSGAGKSTLLRLVMAIERPTRGAVLVNGQNVGALKRRAIPFLRRRIGMVFQDQKLLFDRSVLDNVLLPLSIEGLPRAEAMKRAHAALDKVGLTDRDKAFPVALSGGEQQRLAIARAVVNRPTILLADEPTTQFDEATAADIAAIFQEFNRAGVTVVITTCDMERFPRALGRHERMDAGWLMT